MKTIKQLSDELGISKQALTKYINNSNDNLRQLVVKDGNKFLIDETLEIIIKNHYSKSFLKEWKGINDNLNDNETATREENVNSELLSILKKELEKKDNLIEGLREENKSLNNSLVKALEKQQQLMLDLTRNEFSDKLLRAKEYELEQERQKEIVKDSILEQNENIQKKSWWQKIFGG